MQDDAHEVVMSCVNAIKMLLIGRTFRRQDNTSTTTCPSSGCWVRAKVQSPTSRIWSACGSNTM